MDTNYVDGGVFFTKDRQYEPGKGLKSSFFLGFCFSIISESKVSLRVYLS
jgi:hypothetical protein